MKSTPFDLRVFIRMVLFYLAGVAAIVGLLALFRDFGSKEFHWLVAGVGFFVFPAALMVGVGRFHANIVVLTLVFVLIVWGVLFGQIYYDENEILHLIIRAGSSIITAVAIVVAIHNVVRLRFPVWTIVATALSKIFAFWVLDRFENNQFFNEPAYIFLLFNSLMFLPLVVSLSMKKEEERA